MAKEFNNEYYKNRYKEKREQILNNKKCWRAKNPDKVRAYNQKYYARLKFDTLKSEI